jgi:putative hydrolase
VSTPFGFTGPGGDAGDGAPFLRELEKLLSWSGGPVNWDLAQQVAVRATTAADAAAPVTTADLQAATDAVRLADVWLDGATSLPSGAAVTQAWTRRRWVEATLPAWRALCDPVATRVVDALRSGLTGGLAALQAGELPPELAGMLPAGTSATDLAAATGPVLGMMSQLGGLLFGAQVGEALGALAGEVLTGTDVGLPLAAAGVAALLPAAVTSFAAGLELPIEEARLWLALREAAHQRLFRHVPWLAAHLTSAVEDYARGIAVDPEAVARAASELNPTDPESFQRALGSGMFEAEVSPAQQAALARLETALALVEGWVDEVVAAAADGRLPAAAALREAVRRRRATGGPAEQTFATLVGLELRPRRLREAAALWHALTEARGPDGRDAIWSTPDLLPSSADLDDPTAYVGGGGGGAVPDDPVAEIERLTREGSRDPDTDPDPGTGQQQDGPDSG